MAVVSRVVGPSVASEPLPAARAEFGLRSGFADRLVQGTQDLGKAISGIVQQEQEKADAAQLLEAQRKLGDWERSWFDPANENGVYAHKGRDALGLVEKIDPDFQRVQSELTQNIRNPRARVAFGQWSANKRESVLDRVNGYSVKEHDDYVASEFEATVVNQADAAALAATEGRGADHVQETRQGLNAIDAWGKLQGEAPEVTQRRRQTYLDSIHSKVVDSFIVNKQFDAAAKYMDANLGAMSPSAAVQMQAKLQPILDERQNDADIAAIDLGRAPGVAAVSADYPAKRRQLESGGNPMATNPNSSAAGPDQFTSGTWTRLVARIKPSWAEGKSPQQILDMRFDADKSAEMCAHLDRENAGYLQRYGLPVDDEALYLCHHFGPDKAVAILRAPDNKPMAQIVPPEVMDANPYLKGKTKAEMIANHQRRGMTPSTAPEINPGDEPRTLQDKLALADATITDPDRLKQVKAGLRQKDNERESAKAAAERAMADAIWKHAEEQPPSVPPEQIVAAIPGSEFLSAQDRFTYVENIRKRQQQRIENTFVQDDPKLVEDLSRLAALDPEAFIKTDIRANFAKLSSPTLNALVAKQAAMVGKPEKWAEARSEEQMLGSAYVELKLTGDNKLAERQQLRDRYAEEKRQFIDTHGGKAPTEAEREVILGRLLVWGARNVQHFGGLWTTRETKRLYQIKPGEMRTQNPNGYDVAMSVEQQQAVLALLKRAGVPPTAANIRRVMLERGGKL